MPYEFSPVVSMLPDTVVVLELPQFRMPYEALPVVVMLPEKVVVLLEPSL